MHISKLNEVQKLNDELIAIRSQIDAIDNEGLDVEASNGHFLSISPALTDTFTKLLLIELAEKKAKLVDQLAALGVSADDLSPSASCAFEVSPSNLEELFGAIFGAAPMMHSGGVVNSPFNHRRG